MLVALLNEIWRKIVTRLVEACLLACTSCLTPHSEDGGFDGGNDVGDAAVGDAGACVVRAQQLAQEYAASIRMIETACTSDSDCALAFTSIRCAELCQVAVSAPKIGEVESLRTSFDARCEECVSGVRCVSPPGQARCRNRFCRTEGGDGG